MPSYESSYAIAQRGRATSFTEAELPPEYALEMKNRFINAAGGTEKRQGMSQLGNTVSGAPNLDGNHELVLPTGTPVLFVSGNGKIWKFDDPGYTQVHSGFSSSVPLTSVQMDEKLIFVNGIDRNFYTEDGTIFAELVSIIERGSASTGTDEDSLQDSTVDNWITDTDVAINDLVLNKTLDAYAIVNAISTASVGHSAIGPLVVSEIGVASAAPAANDRYEIQDLVELNVIPTDGEDDNVAILVSASPIKNRIAVSAVSDWTQTDTRVGDWVRNTTQVGLYQVTAIATAALHVTGVSGATEGDSLIFMKSAMPITQRAHVHFGRLYNVDSRDKRLIRISGPDNPEDMTSGAATLDSSTFKFGSIQPVGDIVLAMGSFQRFFAMAGKRNLYLYQGTDPIADEATSVIDFDIIGLFPEGLVSENGLTSLGNDLVWITPDGVQSAALVDDASSLGRSNLSEAIKTTLRNELETAGNVRGWHYPRRSFYMLKVDSQIHVFNYTAYYGRDRLTSEAKGKFSTQLGSWSLFDGKFARQNAYLVRQDGSLICCGPGGKVYTFDDGTYDDDGEEYSTTYQTGWLTLERKERRTVNTKQGNYIKPVFDTGAAVNYSLTAEAGFDGESTTTITIPVSGGASPIGLSVVGVSPIGGTTIQNTKWPLRWRGEQVRLTFITNDNLGPDTISRFTLYATKWGKR